VRRPAAVFGVVLAAAAAVGLAACASDPYGQPLEGQAARMRILPGAPPVKAAWPVAWRRGAEFEIENASGAAIETIIFEFDPSRRPQELLEAVIANPPGHRATVLHAPHGTWSVRARLGDPGSVLLPAGEGLTLRVRVSGNPGSSVAIVTVPGVTPR